MKDIIKVAKAVEANIKDRHIRAHPERDLRGVGANDATADDDDLSRPDTRHPAHQNATSAVDLLKVIRANVDGHPAGNFAHRRQQRQRSIWKLDCLVCDPDDSAIDQNASELGLGGEMQVGVEHLIFTHEVILGVNRLFHFDDHVGAGEDIGMSVSEIGASGHILRVAEATSYAGRRFNKHLMSVSNILTNARRGSGDAVFVVLNLLGDSNNHADRPLPLPIANRSLAAR